MPQGRSGKTAQKVVTRKERQANEAGKRQVVDTKTTSPATTESGTEWRNNQDFRKFMEFMNDQYLSKSPHTDQVLYKHEALVGASAGYPMNSNPNNYLQIINGELSRWVSGLPQDTNSCVIITWKQSILVYAVNPKRANSESILQLAVGANTDIQRDFRDDGYQVTAVTLPSSYKEFYNLWFSTLGSNSVVNSHKYVSMKDMEDTLKGTLISVLKQSGVLSSTTAAPASTTTIQSEIDGPNDYSEIINRELSKWISTLPKNTNNYAINIGEYGILAQIAGATLQLNVGANGDCNPRYDFRNNAHHITTVTFPPSYKKFYNLWFSTLGSNSVVNSHKYISMKDMEDTLKGTLISVLKQSGVLSSTTTAPASTTTIQSEIDWKDNPEFTQLMTAIYSSESPRTDQAGNIPDCQLTCNRKNLDPAGPSGDTQIIK